LGDLEAELAQLCVNPRRAGSDVHNPDDVLRGRRVSAGLMTEGTVIGTPAYMAPEQFLGRRADATSDQFGFCVALHEALWGYAPFGGETQKDR
jgi:serine/threonine protein kinase